MRNTRIKFCGITRKEDVDNAAALGVNALGFVFYAQSPRYVAPDFARGLSVQCPPFITRVGLFMNEEAGTIEQVLEQVSLDLLQFHGSEEEAFCVSFGKPYIKSIAMGGNENFGGTSDFPTASAILLDSNEAGQPGGLGTVFDWQVIPQKVNKPLILAGGLTASNVGKAISNVQPYAVDVSSGIESSKGIKDMDKMTDFVASVRAADGR